MKLNLFQGRDWPWWVTRLVADIREKHTAAGGKAEDFSDYMREQGIYFDGTMLTIEDKWTTYVKLKFEDVKS